MFLRPGYDRELNFSGYFYQTFMLLFACRNRSQSPGWVFSGLACEMVFKKTTPTGCAEAVMGHSFKRKRRPSLQPTLATAAPAQPTIRNGQLKRAFRLARRIQRRFHHALW